MTVLAASIWMLLGWWLIGSGHRAGFLGVLLGCVCGALVCLQVDNAELLVVHVVGGVISLRNWVLSEVNEQYL